MFEKGQRKSLRTAVCIHLPAQRLYLWRRVCEYCPAGVPGALLTVLGTALPPLIIISVISLFYQAFRDSAIVSMAMAGMLCGVAAVIFDVVIHMVKTVARQKRILPLLVLLGSFTAVRFFGVNIILVILVCGVIGALETCRQQKRSKEAKEE